MVQSLASFAAAAVAGLVLTPRIRDWAIRRGLLDQALTTRKIHDRPVPRLGGLAIVAAFFVALLGLIALKGGTGGLARAEALQVAGVCLGGLMIAAIGVYDDVRGVGARGKLAVQCSAAVLMYAVGFRIDEIATPFGLTVPLGPLALPFTVLWFVGVINAMNLIDGLDGLAAGVAFAAISSTFAVAALHGESLTMLISASVAGAVLGFLIHNFNPASVFMGDTGSMFLGFVLAAAAIPAHRHASGAVDLLAPVVALGLPIADTLLAMLRRGARARPMFLGDREHIHHVLLARGFTHRQACLSLYAVAAVLGVAGVVLSETAGTAWAALVLLLLLAGGGALVRWLGYFRLERVPEVVELRRRNLGLRASARFLGNALRSARESEDIWRQLRAFAPALGVSGLGLSLVERGAEGKKVIRYSDGLDELGENIFRAWYGVTPERIAESGLELAWADGRSSIDRDTEIAIELACTHIATAIERIDREARAGRAARSNDQALAPVVEMRKQASEHLTG